MQQQRPGSQSGRPQAQGGSHNLQLRNEKTDSSTALSATNDTRMQRTQQQNPAQGAMHNQYQSRYYSGPQPGLRAPNTAHDAADRPQLQNIVSTAHLNAKLNLYDIGLKGKNVEYKPKRFAAAIMRIREPKTTALIFASGKMVCTGAKSEADSYTAAQQYAKALKKIGNKDVKLSDFKI